MPYNSELSPVAPTSKPLPEYVHKLAHELKLKWVSVYNKAESLDGPEVAVIVANEWLKSRLTESSITARTSTTVERVSFVMDTEQLITRTADGEECVSFKLADNMTDKFGVQLPDEVLQQWAEQINSGAVVLGDIDHQAFEILLRSGASDAVVKQKIKEKPSIAKAIRAVFEKGKLWVKAVIDKRYKKTIEKSKGVSLEAAIKRDTSGKVFAGELLGFTFGIKHDPVIPGTEVYV